MMEIEQGNTRKKDEEEEEEMMEIEQGNTRKKDEEEEEEESEEIPNDFQCCVCLDLFYKPVVLACGHIACFWCVFNSMDVSSHSQCMVCRHPYNHFPRVCRLLHFLLQKLYPLSYKRRERQVSEEEKKRGHVSPQFDDYLYDRVNFDNDGKDTGSLHSGCIVTKSDSLGPGQSSSTGIMSKNVLHESKTSLTTRINNGATSKRAIESVTDENGDCKHLLTTDLQCSLCKQLLCRPVVLNCGDVLCEPCILNPGDKVHKCPVCHSVHPNGFPNVCLVIEHFLEEQFSGEYAARKQSVAEQTDGQEVSQSSCSTKNQMEAGQSSSAPRDHYPSWLSGQALKTHIGVGCDYCGMCPIIGERYRCKDCVEKIGFDLCEQCYHSSSKLPGRFNQQHTEKHEFEIVEPLHFNDFILRLEAESYDDDGSNDDP